MSQIDSWSVRSLFIAVCLLSVTHAALAEETALDRYIAKPDANYSWKLVSRSAGSGQTTYVLSLTSQEWRSKGEVD